MKVYFIECKLVPEHRRDSMHVVESAKEFNSALEDISISMQLCDQAHDKDRGIMMFSFLIKSHMELNDIVRRISGGDNVRFGECRDFAKGSPLCRGDRYSVLEITGKPFFNYGQAVNQWLAKHFQ